MIKYVIQRVRLDWQGYHTGYHVYFVWRYVKNNPYIQILLFPISLISLFLLITNNTAYIYIYRIYIHIYTLYIYIYSTTGTIIPANKFWRVPVYQWKSLFRIWPQKRASRMHTCCFWGVCYSGKITIHNISVKSPLSSLHKCSIFVYSCSTGGNITLPMCAHLLAIRQIQCKVLYRFFNRINRKWIYDYFLRE